MIYAAVYRTYTFHIHIDDIILRAKFSFDRLLDDWLDPREQSIIDTLMVQLMVSPSEVRITLDADLSCCVRSKAMSYDGERNKSFMTQFPVIISIETFNWKWFQLKH